MVDAQTQTLIAWIVPAVLFVIMLAMGLGLERADFVRVAQRPRAVIIGCIAQLLVLPAMAFSLAFAFDAPPEVAVGLVLLASAPGGPTSNLFSDLARGDTALSITLTAVGGVVVPFTLPLFVGLALRLFLGTQAEIALPIGQTVVQLLVVTLVPVVLGMTLRERRPQLAARIERVLKRVAVWVLALMIVGAVAKERARIGELVVQAGVLVLVLNVSTMALGFVLGRAARLSAAQSVTLTLEVGIQNAALAMAVALGILGSAAIAIPAALYGMLMYASCFAVVLVARRFLPPRAAGASVPG